jgi:CRISPR-associated protein Cmx8
MKADGAQHGNLAVEYDLFSLPTAQHKAGLAGMLLMIETLKERKMAPIPVVEELSATRARVVFTRESLQIVFDDLYDASWIEREYKTKWTGQDPKAVKEKEIQADGKKKIERTYVYDVVEAKGAFLQHLYPTNDAGWVKLWRDMLWSILRGIPATRNIYEDRADNKSCSLAGELWTSLKKSVELTKRGQSRTENISSSLFIGAEDSNAEKVPFKGAVEHNLLLHFWPIVSLIYVPRIIGVERSDEQKLKIKRDEGGYVLAIPEPSNLKEFCSDVRQLLRGLETDAAGFRPKSALIDLHEEGGLEYLYHFAKVRIDHAEEIAFSLCAVELYHLQKQGNRIRQLAAERILPSKHMLRDYENLRKAATNPFFKSLCIRNLLDGRQWYEGADSGFHRNPMPIFVFCKDRTPREIRFFGIDARKKLESIEYDLNIRKQGGIMGEKEHDDQLTLRVYRLIQTYVNQKTEDKSGKKFKDFRENKDDKNRIIYPQEYREAREKVCTDAFLAMRGRRDQDFIEYFAGSICSVPQYMSEGDYVAVAGALMTNWEKIKTLSMLALSAHSYLSQPD